VTVTSNADGQATKILTIKGVVLADGAKELNFNDNIILP
jgi:hypothetical protein